MSVTAAMLDEWRDELGELDHLVCGIRGDDDRKRARQLVDKLEREIFETYLDVNAAEVREAVAETITVMQLEQALAEGARDREQALANQPSMPGYFR